MTEQAAKNMGNADKAANQRQHTEDHQRNGDGRLSTSRSQ
jgi:hypothetical protein